MCVWFFQIKKVKLVGFRKKSCTGKTPTNSAGGGREESGEGDSQGSERQDDPEDTTTEDPLLVKEKQISLKGGTQSSILMGFYF